MKRIFYLLVFVFLAQIGNAQDIQVSNNQTVSIVFPYSIIHADRGSSRLLVQLIKEAENVLLVKAADSLPLHTNLTVLTADGSVYSFNVDNVSELKLLIVYAPVQKKESVEVQARALIDNPKIIRGGHDAAWGVSIELTGVYVKDNILYYQFQLQNESSIDYPIELIRFYIRDKKKGKRTAVQDIEVVPKFIAGNTKMIPAMGGSVIVVAVEQFTIPDAKYFGIEVFEANGGRNLSLRTNNKVIVRAKVI